MKRKHALFIGIPLGVMSLSFSIFDVFDIRGSLADVMMGLMGFFSIMVSFMIAFQRIENAVLGPQSDSNVGVEK